MFSIKNLSILLCIFMSAFGQRLIIYQYCDKNETEIVTTDYGQQESISCTIKNYEPLNSNYYYYDQSEKIFTLEINHSNISSISDILRNFNALRTLKIRNTTLSHIKRIDHRNLRKIELQSNSISSFERYAFAHCNHLSSVNLSHNNISKLTEPLFSSGFKLQEMDLSFNQIYEISLNFINSVQKIKNLILRQNLVEYFDLKNIDGRYLELLDLSYNKLVEFKSPNYYPLENFTLKLEFNELTSLDINTLNIKFLDVFNNNIKSFSLGYNCVNLNAQNNEISIISLEESINSLQNMNLNNNKLGNDLQDICKCTNLSSLYLDGNNIDNIGSCFSEMKNLKILSLQRNNIYEIHHNNFNEKNTITHLYLANNHLETFDEHIMSVLHNVIYLDLSQNHIIDIYDNPRYWMHSLQEISLSQNKFKCSKLLLLMKKFENDKIKLINNVTLPENVTNIKGIQCYDKNEKDFNGTDITSTKLNEKILVLAERLNSMNEKYNKINEVNETVNDIIRLNTNFIRTFNNMSENTDKAFTQITMMEKKLKNLENLTKYLTLTNQGDDTSYNEKNKNDLITTSTKQETSLFNVAITFLLTLLVVSNLVIVLRKFRIFPFRRGNFRDTETPLTNISTM